MDFLIHYRIQDPAMAALLLQSLRDAQAILCEYEGTVLAHYQSVGKKGLIAHLQETLLHQPWVSSDFLHLYFSVQGSTLDCWMMKRAGRGRMLRMREDHPFFGV